jgi:hypothetical protein
MAHADVRLGPHPCPAGTHWWGTEQRGLQKRVELIAVQLADNQA